MKIIYNRHLKELARQLRNNGTKAEVRLWQLLKGKQMMGYDFHRQKPIDNYIADFFCNKLKLVIELDGFTHTFEGTIQKDVIKEERLKALGINVIRFTDDEIVNHTDSVLEKIQAYIQDFEARTLTHD